MGKRKASTSWGHISKIGMAVVTHAHTHLDLPQSGCSQSLCVAGGNTQQSNERLVHLALVMRIPLNRQRRKGPIRALVNLIRQPIYYAIRSTFVYYSNWSMDCGLLLFFRPTTQCTTQAASTSPHWPTHHTVAWGYIHLQNVGPPVAPSVCTCVHQVRKCPRGHA